MDKPQDNRAADVFIAKPEKDTSGTSGTYNSSTLTFHALCVCVNEGGGGGGSKCGKLSTMFFPGYKIQVDIGRKSDNTYGVA